MKFSQRLVVVVCCVGALWVIWSTSTWAGTHKVVSDHPEEVEVRVDSQSKWISNSVEDMRETLEIVKGHLSILRKELGMNSSTEVSNNSERVDSRKWLYERLRNDPHFENGQHSDSLKALARAFGDAERDSKADGEEDEVSEHDVKIPMAVLPPRLETSQDAHDRSNFRVKPVLTPTIFATLRQVVEKKFNAYKKKRRKGITIHPHKARKNSSLAAWKKFHNGINQYELYGQFDHNIDQLLKDMSYKSIVGLEEIGDLGTQVKMVFKLNYGGKGLFKPMRFDKDTEANPNHYMFDDFERHHAEIAAFHLDRVLNFRRVPPVSGRYVNVTRDVERWASHKFRKTFFTSPANNRCFYGVCDAYCDSGQAICGNPEVVEGSLAVWLPDESQYGTRQHWANPWAQSYSMKREAKWSNDSAYCEKVKKNSPYNRGRRLLDIMDMAVFDFLCGNMDRHHYHTFKHFGNYTFVLLFDNGRGFGRPRHDEVGLLAPVSQCCQIRASTLKSLLDFAEGPPSLGDAMRLSLARDSANPVLNELYLAALDRRLRYIIETVFLCGIDKDSNWDSVIINDGF